MTSPGTLFLVPGFPSDEGDSSCVPAIQNYVAAYAAAHPERDVHVITFHYPYARGLYCWNGATIHALGGRNRRGWHRPSLWGLAFLTAIREGRRAGSDVVHSFWLGECALVGHWVASRLGAAHVASIGGQDARANNRYLKLLPLDRMTVTAGSAFADAAFRASTSRSADAVVPIGLDAASFRADDAETGRDIDVLGVGSLIELKRYDLFIDLIAGMIPHHPALRAVIVGDGPNREQLALRIRALGLGTNVRLVGAVGRDEVFDYMRRSRVLLHPSDYESQGYVLLEALASNMYVVCREVGYVGDHPNAHRCRSEQEMKERLQQLVIAPPPACADVLHVTESVRRFDEVYERARRR